MIYLPSFENSHNQNESRTIYLPALENEKLNQNSQTMELGKGPLNGGQGKLW